MGTMAQLTLFYFSLFSLISVALSRAIDQSRYESVPAKFFRRDYDPQDFSWVKKMGAIGDSFTAGIGAGSPLGSFWGNRADWKCSRYDQAYPNVVYDEISDSVEKFQYLACSGDRSTGIYDQVKELDDDMDFIIMTAGGNDLCLAGMIKACVILPKYGEDVCEEIIDKAKENLDTILKPNLIQILTELDDHMNKDGIVVYNGYARFFNASEEKCGDDEMWWLIKDDELEWLELTKERRKTFNELVLKINEVIEEAIEEAQKKVDYTLAFSNWDKWPYEAVDGLFCSPNSSGRYPDSEQPDLHFFKFDTTRPNVRPNDEWKKRSLKPLTKRSLYDSLLYKSVNPRADVLHKLDRRAPKVPDCPGDGPPDEEKDLEAIEGEEISEDLGMGTPDSFGKIFHPNELGHLTIASFCLSAAMEARARVLGVDGGECPLVDEFKCWSDDGDKGYATMERVAQTYKDFCEELEPNTSRAGWTEERKFDEGTPDEHKYTISLTGDAKKYSKDECLSSFKRIIHGCDKEDDDNPLSWKRGGSWQRGKYEYRLDVKRKNRPRNLKEPFGTCRGNNHFWYADYTIYGAGFSSWDHGKKTLLPSIKDCLGEGVTSFEFEYFDGPNQFGHEWLATFNTPGLVNSRCFKNNKVVFAAHGFTDGCEGDDF
ncbi:hypothetical protein NW759_002925 [Fusarium solani]|nr:hypothetical protein NW759_002925 [Fusarium solani]